MKLVVIKQFDDYISAHLVLGRLQEEDIVCYLQDEHTTTTAPFLTNFSGGIKLLVPETQAERAIKLLESFDFNASS
jgi:hypothetical protein